MLTVTLAHQFYNSSYTLHNRIVIAARKDQVDYIVKYIMSLEKNFISVISQLEKLTFFSL